MYFYNLTKMEIDIIYNTKTNTCHTLTLFNHQAGSGNWILGRFSERNKYSKEKA